MGFAHFVVLGVTLLAACGGRSRLDIERVEPWGTETGGTGAGVGGATGGTGGSVTNASDESEIFGCATKSSYCGNAAEDYVGTTAEACQTSSYRCDPGAAAFADYCGCGCDPTPFDESDGTPFEDIAVD